MLNKEEMDWLAQQYQRAQKTTKVDKERIISSQEHSRR